ncbi:MAG TPA: hypothetical protein DIW30_03225 [Bacteroidales bacterium]|nr:hypothetical protein [Bacteroidales bacterium]
MKTYTMKHVLLVISLFLSSVASAAEQLPVLLPLKGTVIDEYKQEVRNSKVQVVSAPAPVQMPEWKNGVQLYETAEANCSAGCVTITGGNVGQWNGSRSVAVKSVESKASSTLSAVTMEKIRKEPLPAVSAVTTKQMALRRVAASVEDPDEATTAGHSDRRRLGGSGEGMGGSSGDDPNRSELSPVGEGYILFLFALFYGGWAIYRKKKELKKMD